MSHPISNRLAAARQADLPEPAGVTLGPEEILVPDVRGSLSPSQMVDLKLLALLRKRTETDLHGARPARRVMFGEASARLPLQSLSRDN
jgi:hypothetical protein